MLVSGLRHNESKRNIMGVSEISGNTWRRMFHFYIPRRIIIDTDLQWTPHRCSFVPLLLRKSDNSLIRRIYECLWLLILNTASLLHKSLQKTLIYADDWRAVESDYRPFERYYSPYNYHPHKHLKCSMSVKQDVFFGGEWWGHVTFLMMPYLWMISTAWPAVCGGVFI